MKKFRGFVIAGLVLLTSAFTFAQTPIGGFINGGVNLPLGDFDKVYKMGASAEAGLFYAIPKSGLDVTLSVGYNGFKYKNEYFTDMVKAKLGVGVTGFNPDWTATDIPVMIGIKYKFPTKGIHPYLTGELGAHFMSFSDRITENTIIIGSSSDPSNITLNNNTESASETGFGAAFGAGVLFPVAKKVALDLGIKYNYSSIVFSKVYTVFRNNNSQFTTEEVKNPMFFTFRGGVVINF